MSRITAAWQVRDSPHDRIAASSTASSPAARSSHSPRPTCSTSDCSTEMIAKDRANAEFLGQRTAWAIVSSGSPGSQVGGCGCSDEMVGWLSPSVAASHDPGIGSMPSVTDRRCVSTSRHSLGPACSIQVTRYLPKVNGAALSKSSGYTASYCPRNERPPGRCLAVLPSGERTQQSTSGAPCFTVRSLGSK